LSRSRWIVAGVLAAAAWLVWEQYRSAVPVPGTSQAASVASRTGDDGLPSEARDTLRLIARGGPFPHDRDGVVFGNFEKRLPQKPRGFYREYTVPTPGIGHRGARRIVAGGNPPAEFYYTDDHYESFRRIEVAP
jgi:ribonuclease T1